MGEQLMSLFFAPEPFGVERPGFFQLFDMTRQGIETWLPVSMAHARSAM